MAQKSIGGSMNLAGKIRARRTELNLTIEDAARIAGVGVKTWCRYEAGESIRQDKCKGVCRALKWRSLPSEEGTAGSCKVIIDRTHEAWSKAIEEEYGEKAAAAFAAASDVLLDHIKEDLEALSSKPKGTHLGELEFSWLASDLPPQFLTEYDYEVLYMMKTRLIFLRILAKGGCDMRSRCVLEDVLYLLMAHECEFLAVSDPDPKTDGEWTNWALCLLGDREVCDYLYANLYLPQTDDCHISHWLDEIYHYEPVRRNRNNT